MKRSRIRSYYFKKAVSVKDGEGNIHIEYEKPMLINGEDWPAGGKVQVEMYGNRLSYIRNLKIQGSYRIKPDENGVMHYIFPNGVDIVEGDGICVHVPKDAVPDYKIISIKPYHPLKLEVERI